MTDKAKVVIVMTNCPDADSAIRIANFLVEEQLAACVNCLSGVTSTYIWKGAVETVEETTLLIKTTEQQFEAVKERIGELHPYELPEVIAIPVCAGAENYLEWVRDNVK